MPRQPVQPNQQPLPSGVCAFCGRPLPAGRYCGRDCAALHSWHGCRPENVWWRSMTTDERKPVLKAQLLEQDAGAGSAA